MVDFVQIIRMLPVGVSGRGGRAARRITMIARMIEPGVGEHIRGVGPLAAANWPCLGSSRGRRQSGPREVAFDDGELRWRPPAATVGDFDVLSGRDGAPSPPPSRPGQPTGTPVADLATQPWPEQDYAPQVPIRVLQ